MPLLEVASPYQIVRPEYLVMFLYSAPAVSAAVSVRQHRRDIEMAGWEQACDKLNQEQARQERRKELAEDTAQRLVRVLDPRIRQFVQTLRDHNQWPMVSRQVTEKKVGKKEGLLWTRFEEKTVTKTVNEPSSVEMGYTQQALEKYDNSYAHYQLTIPSSQEWRLSKIIPGDWESYADPICYRTAKGTGMGSTSELVHWSSGKLLVDLEMLCNALIKQMAQYLTQRGLPLPQD